MYVMSSRDSFQFKSIHRPKVKEWKIFQANRNQKSMSITIHISDKIDFTLKMGTRDKECNYIMIKKSILQE